MISIKKQILIFTLPMFIWLTLIFMLSSQPYKEQDIKPFLKQYLTNKKAEQVVPDITIHYRGREIEAKRTPYSFIEFIFRKFAHLLMYGVLAVISYFSMEAIKPRKIWNVPLVLVFVVLTASLDEWNQLNSSMRTGAVQDVIVDFTGACIGLLCCVIVQAFMKKSV